LGTRLREQWSAKRRWQLASADSQERAIRQPFRLLVTGSRTWDDTTAIEDALTAILARHPKV
jgi:hypothetical protein